MSFDLDIADDFASVVDWIKPVVVDGTEVEHALRRAIATKEAMASGGKYLASDVAFHLDSADHPEEPVIGTSIVDDDGTWTVLETAWQTLARRWRCVCRQLKIVGGQTVTIQSATYQKGATGAEEPTFSTVLSDVVARVQLETSTVESSNTNRTVVTKASVYFAEPLDLGASHRIISSGTTLKVLSWEGFDPIEQLFKANCEVSRWPHA